MKIILALFSLCLTAYSQTPACSAATSSAATCTTTAVITIPANSYKDSLIAWMDAAKPVATITSAIGTTDTTISMTALPANFTLAAGQAILLDIAPYRDPCLVVSVTSQNSGGAVVVVTRQPESLVAVSSHAGPSGNTPGAPVRILAYPNVIAMFIGKSIFPGLSSISQALGSRSTTYPGNSGVAQ